MASAKGPEALAFIGEYLRAGSHSNTEECKDLLAILVEELLPKILSDSVQLDVQLLEEVPLLMARSVFASLSSPSTTVSWPSLMKSLELLGTVGHV